MNVTALRLHNQQLSGTSFNKPEELVRWMGALQGQDYAMSKWAIGVRLPGITHDAVEQAINEARIVRTHALRPTWHLVAAEDARWMLELSAPVVKRIAASTLKPLGVGVELFSRTNPLIEKFLAGKSHTREEIMAELSRQGIITNTLVAAHVMFWAELDGIVCNGPMRGKQFTYALLDERVPAKGPGYSRDEAAAELARRYFTSHGPASLADFTWWSGLNVSEARTALEAVKKELHSDRVEDTEYWHNGMAGTGNNPDLLLLPAFDEYMVSYKDRSAALDPKNFATAMTGNGIFKPIIVHNGMVTGVWKRTVAKDRVVVEPLFFRKKDHPGKTVLKKVLESYSQFMGIPVMLV